MKTSFWWVFPVFTKNSSKGSAKCSTFEFRTSWNDWEVPFWIYQKGLSRGPQALRALFLHLFCSNGLSQQLPLPQVLYFSGNLRVTTVFKQALSLVCVVQVETGKPVLKVQEINGGVRKVFVSAETKAWAALFPLSPPNSYLKLSQMSTVHLSVSSAWHPWPLILQSHLPVTTLGPVNNGC